MFEILFRSLSLIRPLVVLRWAIVVALVAVLWVVTHYEALQTYFTSRDRRQQYGERVVRLQQEQAALQGEQAALKSGGFQTEKAIRERLLMVKPGEKILFVDPPDSTTGSLQNK